MIKRPLVWILGAFLPGVMMARQTVSIGIIIVLCLSFVILLSLLLYQKPDRIVSRLRGCFPGIIHLKKDRFLWSLPVMLLAGYLTMQSQLRLPELYYAFEQEVPCEISGQVSRIVEKEWGEGPLLYQE